MQVKEVIQAMIETYGEESQIDVSIEEMSELIKELIKYKRTKRYARESNFENRDGVIEELGDVLFMVEYLKTIFKVSDEHLTQVIEKKAKRTAERYLHGKE